MRAGIAGKGVEVVSLLGVGGSSVKYARSTFLWCEVTTNIYSSQQYTLVQPFIPLSHLGPSFHDYFFS